jgi:hypothetical protein
LNAVREGIVAVASPTADRQERRVVQVALVSGCLLTALLVIVTLARYPGNAATATSYRTLGGIAIIVLLAVSGWFAWRGVRAMDEESMAARRLGLRGGLLFGLLWVLEISFNNFVPPDISTGPMRDRVDSTVLAAIAAGVLILSAVAAFRNGAIKHGLLAGYWSGLVSGLIACLMGLLLIVPWMRLLVRDPLMISEFAERGAADGAPDLATYIAYETLTGALLHLVLLGMALGLLLGGVGGRGLV